MSDKLILPLSSLKLPFLGNHFEIRGKYNLPTFRFKKIEEREFSELFVQTGTILTNFDFLYFTINKLSLFFTLERTSVSSPSIRLIPFVCLPEGSEQSTEK